MIYLHPDTHEVLSGPQDGAIPAYVSIRGGVLHAMIRATDKATFRQQALTVGLMVQLGTVGEADYAVRYHRNVTVAEEQPDRADPRSAPMPRIMLTAGTYDDEGNELTAPVFDTRYHANFWLNPEATAAGAWKQWAIAWSQQGTPGTPNAEESSLALNGIELIDPDSIRSPSNRLA